MREHSKGNMHALPKVEQTILILCTGIIYFYRTIKKYGILTNNITYLPNIFLTSTKTSIIEQTTAKCLIGSASRTPYKKFKTQSQAIDSGNIKLNSSTTKKQFPVKSVFNHRNIKSVLKQSWFIRAAHIHGLAPTSNSIVPGLDKLLNIVHEISFS